MSINHADKIVALLAGLKPSDIQALPPAERRRFADWCRRAADLADPPPKAPSSGVLAQLGNGAPRHGG